MADFDFDFDFNWGDDFDTKKYFVKRHGRSDNIINFSDVIQRNSTMRFEIVDSLNLKIPKCNESYFAITTKAISLLDVVNFFENKVGKIEECIIFFYTVNEKGAKYTVDLSKRSKLKVIISDIMNSQRTKERLITSIFDENNVEIVFCHNHAKIVSFKIGDNYFTLTGSMNAGNNARVESLELINDKKMYDFISNTFDVFKDKFQITKRY